MSDPPLSATTMGAVTLWIAAFVVAAIYAFEGTRGLGVFAILLAGGGATLTVRRYMLKLADDLLDRERRAFDLGRESSQIRRVD